MKQAPFFARTGGMSDYHRRRTGLLRAAVPAALAIPVCLMLAGVPLAHAAFAADDVTQTRSVTGFEKIHLNGAFTVTVRAGSRQTRVTVSAGRDIIDRVTTEVHGGTLEVAMRGSSSFWPGSAPKLSIDLPALSGFANDGAGSATITGLSGGDLAISNAGASSVTASGRAASVDITNDGTGKIDSTALAAGDVSVTNNGVGSIKVRASGDLTATINGVGEIRYVGDPAHVTSSINGIGKISRL